MVDKDGIAARIRKLRGNLSQIKFGNIFGLSQATVAHIERGRNDPSLDFLVSLCGEYGVSADFILRGCEHSMINIHDPEKTALKRFCKKHCGAQLIFYGFGFLGWKSKTGASRIFVKIPMYFLIVNASIFVAWWRYLTGRRLVMWTPSER